MSAFLCSDRHVFHVAAWAYAAELVDDPVNCAIVLRSLNNLGQLTRYTDAPVPLAFVRAGMLEAVGALGKMTTTYRDQYAHSLLYCLRYQCSEADGLNHIGEALLISMEATAAKLSQGRKADVYSI